MALRGRGGWFSAAAARIPTGARPCAGAFTARTAGSPWPLPWSLWSPAPTLDELARALAYPARALYLGRASCPPALPLFRGEIIEARSPRQALELAPVAAEPGTPQGEGGYAVEYSYDPVQPAEPGRELAERHDLRQWRNQLHGGLRTVCSGPPVRPPARKAMPWGLGAESEVQP